MNEIILSLSSVITEGYCEYRIITLKLPTIYVHTISKWYQSLSKVWYWYFFTNYSMKSKVWYLSFSTNAIMQSREVHHILDYPSELLHDHDDEILWNLLITHDHEDLLNIQMKNFGVFISNDVDIDLFADFTCLALYCSGCTVWMFEHRDVTILHCYLWFTCIYLQSSLYFVHAVWVSAG